MFFKMKVEKDKHLYLFKAGKNDFKVCIFYSPFDGYETPTRTQHVATSWTSDYIRSRAKTVVERPSFMSPKNKIGGALSRPISGSYS